MYFVSKIRLPPEKPLQKIDGEQGAQTARRQEGQASCDLALPAPTLAPRRKLRSNDEEKDVI